MFYLPEISRNTRRQLKKKQIQYYSEPKSKEKIYNLTQNFKNKSVNERNLIKTFQKIYSSIIIALMRIM